MPTNITMSFDPDGSVEFTRNKQLDAFFGGTGTMKRVTDILKLPNDPLFYITWLMGPYKGKSHGAAEHCEVFNRQKIAVRCEISEHTGTLFFYSYEDAVAYEIACLNEMREAGVTFDAEAKATTE